MTPEGKLAAYLVRRCKERGVAQRKVSWEGRIGAPDRLLLGRDKSCFVELKAPGAKPTPMQKREHEVLERAGLRVLVCDSEAKIDWVITLISLGA